MTSTAQAPVTLVTGTRKGLGRHLAQHFLDAGHLVVGCSRKPADREHERYLHVLADVAAEPDVRNLFREVRRRFGRLDNLVANAGIAGMNHALLTPASAVERMLATNVVGTFLCAREAARLMTPAGHGRIVTFSTVAVPMALEGEAAYVASKSAVEGLTRVLAREFAPLGITVNAVGPTPVPTDLIRAVPPEKIEALVARQAIHRLGTPDDVTNVVDFFLRPESGFVTGQCVYLGGM